MRMAVGLGGVLVTIGVIAWIMGKVILPYDQASTHAYQQAQVTLNQISGRDENGANIETTYSVFADTRNDGKLHGPPGYTTDPRQPADPFFRSPKG